ncbi:MAG: hypothetical protein GY868_16175, partial [Deltaproteobacteria bacterium]|nr:hypothetical protein [Deltaproteobacteria bacterium]
MKKKPLQLDDLIDMDTPEAVLEEVRTILTQLPDTQDPGRIEAAFGTTVALYQGEYPGYHGCNIAYHNLHHITDTFLAMTRLIHGAHLNGTSLPWLVVELGLISSLFHDTGYIQETHDCDGTGAKHTLNHVQRSMDFVARHALEHSLAEDETALCRDMILCTDLAADIGTTAFPTPQAQLAG